MLSTSRDEEDKGPISKFLAQAQHATIVGTVTDPSGASVPNVAVTLTNTDTGLSHVIPTNDAGQYVAVDLQIGHYRVKAEAKGFKVAHWGDRLF